MGGSRCRAISNNYNRAAGSRKAKATLTLAHRVINLAHPSTGQHGPDTHSHLNPRQMAQGDSRKQSHSKEAWCSDFSKDIQEKRHQRRSKPQPWILLKFAVFLTLCIIGFATYVYVDRFCVPMITHRPEAMGDRVFGSESELREETGHEGSCADSFRHITVVFLAVFGVLLIMMLWTYAKVRVAALHPV